MLGIERNTLTFKEAIQSYTVEEKICQEVKNMEQCIGITKKKHDFVRHGGVFGKNESLFIVVVLDKKKEGV